MFSKSCQYAIQAILFISLKGDKGPVSIKTICEHQNVPNHFLAKILQQLVKQDFLVSIKGPNGGFSINPKIKSFRLIDVVTLIDGNDIFNQCGIGLKECSDENPCPVHQTFKQVKEHVKNILTEKTLIELTNELRTGKTNLIEL